MNDCHVNHLTNLLYTELYNKRFLKIIRLISECNGINLIVDDESAKSSTRKCIINNGDLVILANPNTKELEIMLHELCHILVCIPEYRNYMHINTVDSYKIINDLFYSKYHNEQATLVLHHLLIKKFNIDPMMVTVNISKNQDSENDVRLTLGSLFNKTNWLDEYSDIINSINLNFIEDDVCVDDILKVGDVKVSGTYYAMIHYKWNKDYKLKKFIYDSNSDIWIDCENQEKVKPNYIGVVYKRRNENE